MDGLGGVEHKKPGVATFPGSAARLVSWLSYVTHRLACALARAVAWELATAMELTRVRDARDGE